MRRRALFTAFVGVALVRLAHADEPLPTGAEGKALAEALFQDARTLLDGGRTQEACAKFAMSQRIEPKLGTLMNLATCHEALGKTATAWAEFTEAITRAARANQIEREQFARDHAAALAPQLSRLRLSATDSAPLVVTLDDVTLDRAALDTAFPVDPGDHTLVARSPGRRAWTQTVAIPKGPAMTPLAIPSLPVEEAPEPPKAPLAERPRPNTAAWIAFTTAGVLLTTGTYFGIEAFSKKSDAESECKGPACTQRGLDLFDRAAAYANVSTVVISAAVIAAGVGVYFLLRREPARATARLGPVWTW